MPDQLLQLHRRLEAGDRSASESVARLVLTTLFERVRLSYPRVNEHDVMTGVVDAVLEYCEKPRQVNPESDSHLLNHLQRAAWRNVANLLRGERRRHRREDRFGAEMTRSVEQADPLGTLLQGEDAERRERRIEQLMAQLPDEKDRELLRLRLAGERSSKVFARALGYDHLPINEQRKMVKRAKDRVDKLLRRSIERGQ